LNVLITIKETADRLSLLFVITSGYPYSIAEPPVMTQAAMDATVIAPV